MWQPRSLHLSDQLCARCRSTFFPPNLFDPAWIFISLWARLTQMKMNAEVNKTVSVTCSWKTSKVLSFPFTYFSSFPLFPSLASEISAGVNERRRAYQNSTMMPSVSLMSFSHVYHWAIYGLIQRYGQQTSATSHKTTHPSDTSGLHSAVVNFRHKQSRSKHQRHPNVHAHAW